MLTFEMVMAAMYLAAKTETYRYDYETERIIEELEVKREEEYYEAIKSLRNKYPRDILFNDFVLRCKLYVPAYNQKVECLIKQFGGIQVFYQETVNGVENYLDITPVFGSSYIEKGYQWANPENFNNRTHQMDKTIAEALGFAISCGVYKLRGMEQEVQNCEKKVNSLLSVKNIVFDAKMFLFNNKGETGGLDLYELASTGIDLDEPFVYVEEMNDKKISVPYQLINYMDKNYIVVPCKDSTSCLCITENVIIAVTIEEQINVLNESDKKLTVKAELRDVFAKKIMNRKDVFEELCETDKKFYCEILKECVKLNTFFYENERCDSVREELLNIIVDGVLGNQVGQASLSELMQNLTGKKYYSNHQCILCNNKESNLFEFCIDVYKYEEEI